jgi:hypothetical protein
MNDKFDMGNEEVERIDVDVAIGPDATNPPTSPNNDSKGCSCNVAGHSKALGLPCFAWALMIVGQRRKRLTGSRSGG